VPTCLGPARGLAPNTPSRAQILHPEYGAAAAAVAAASGHGAGEAGGAAQELRLFKDEAELMLKLDHP
jgi:hypothetical protein